MHRTPSQENQPQKGEKTIDVAGPPSTSSNPNNVPVDFDIFNKHSAVSPGLNASLFVMPGDTGTAFARGEFLNFMDFLTGSY